MPRRFYERQPTIVGRQLLGKHLVKEAASVRLVGKIVDVECYGGSDDPASYVAKKLKIGKHLFYQGGYTFLIPIHGHLLLNITAEKEGIPGAILLRAVEPVSGIDTMCKRRNMRNIHTLCNGPGKLTEAFEINKEDDGVDLTAGRSLYICCCAKTEHLQVVASPRIGVDDDKRCWRFRIKDNRFVSHPHS